MRHRPVTSITLPPPVLRVLDELSKSQCRSRSRTIEWLILRAADRVPRDEPTALRAAKLPPEPVPEPEPPARKLPPRVSDEDFRALHAAGLTVHEIAERTGLKPVSVTVRASRIGLSLRGRRGRPPASETKEQPTVKVQIILPRADVKRWREAAKAEGVSFEAWLCRVLP